MKYVLIVLCALVFIIIIRAVMMKSNRNRIDVKEDVEIDGERVVKNLSQAIKIKTVSYSEASKIDWGKFDGLLKFLEETYPLIHSKLDREIVNDHSLIYKWNGTGSSKKPIMFLAHMDVVPIDKSTEKEWEFEPFSGEIKEGYVWGRGALDMKIQLISTLESVEQLLEKGYTPKRDIYLAYGHDEENGGENGAKKIASLFEKKGIEFEYIVDEGGAILEDGKKFIGRPIAFVGTCEKGFSNIRLKYREEGGHSSMPSSSTSLGVMCDAVSKLQKHPMKAKPVRTVKEMIKYIGPEFSFSKRLIVANLWLFYPFMKKKILSIPIGNALMRTTIAATMATGSPAPNVLPQESSATFNVRISPLDSYDKVVSHIKKTVKNPNIEIEPLLINEPSKVSSTTSEGFNVVEKSIYQTYPEVLVSPCMILAGTDSRYYSNVCNNIYRFSPYKLSQDEISGIHGINEKVSIDNIKKCAKFYTLLIINSNVA